jgi:hypothetical protein
MAFWRACVAAVLGCFLTACDPLQVRGLTVSPPPAHTPEQAQEEALALAATVALAHDLHPRPGAPFTRAEGWECHLAEATRLCGKPIADEIYFYFSERGFSLTSRARSLWQELNDRLTATFGVGAVRECRWASRPDPERPEGERAVLRPVCVPLER